VSDDPRPSGVPPERVHYGEGYRRSVALLLMLAYTANSADRTLVAIIGQPMKQDLGLSDTQLGLLVGTAFAFLYAFSGIPVARLAERANRVRIIAIAATAWSLLTALLGSAQSFLQLLLIRTGVGVFEAGCTPPAHSLLSDYFEPRRRTTALSFYSCGISLGYIASAMIGGWVALHYGWRAACRVVGLPGILVALAIARFVEEPPRGNADPSRRGAAAARAGPAGGVRHELSQLAAVARRLLLRRPIAHIVIGVTIATFAAQGSYAFVPAYFRRAFALDYATIGVVTGLAGGVSVALGLVIGGLVTDRLGARAPKWYALTPAIGLVVCTPVYVAAFVAGGWLASAWLIGIAAFFQYVSFGPTFGIVQNVVDARQRATATALIYILLNLIGLGLGPVFTGWLIDRCADFNFSHGTPGSVFASFTAMLDGAPGTGASYHASCPPGSEGDAACRAALALASRQGIAVTVLLYAWSAVHYFLGAFGLEEEMCAAARHNASTESPTESA